MRYIVELEKLSAEVLKNRKKNGMIIWIAVIDSGIDISDPLVSGSVVLERDFTEEGMYDPIGHGTIMARILKVVAPNISLINAKVVDRTGEADEVDIMRAIEWCVNSGVDIMNGRRD